MHPIIAAKDLTCVFYTNGRGDDYRSCHKSSNGVVTIDKDGFTRRIDNNSPPQELFMAIAATPKDTSPDDLPCILEEDQHALEARALEYFRHLAQKGQLEYRGLRLIPFDIETPNVS